MKRLLKFNNCIATLQNTTRGILDVGHELISEQIVASCAEFVTVIIAQVIYHLLVMIYLSLKKLFKQYYAMHE